MKKLNSIIALLICLNPVTNIKANMVIYQPSTAQQKFMDINSEKIYVDVETQRLHLTASNNNILKSYKISTGRNGTGEKLGSYKTPRGLFWIKDKIGENNNPLLKYKARTPVGYYHPSQSRYDNILSRILTLNGMQDHNSNTLQRYVYIHGTSAIKKLGTIPCSLGCVRMNPYEITELFSRVKSGTHVYIHDKGNPLPWEKNTKIHLNQNQSLFTNRRDQTELSQSI